MAKNKSTMAVKRQTEQDIAALAEDIRLALPGASESFNAPIDAILIERTLAELYGREAVARALDLKQSNCNSFSIIAKINTSAGIDVATRMFKSASLKKLLPVISRRTRKSFANMAAQGFVPVRLFYFPWIVPGFDVLTQSNVPAVNAGIKLQSGCIPVAVTDDGKPVYRERALEFMVGDRVMLLREIFPDARDSNEFFVIPEAPYTFIACHSFQRTVPTEKPHNDFVIGEETTNNPLFGAW